MWGMNTQFSTFFLFNKKKKHPHTQTKPKLKNWKRAISSLTKFCWEVRKLPCTDALTPNLSARKYYSPFPFYTSAVLLILYTDINKYQSEWHPYNPHPWHHINLCEGWVIKCRFQIILVSSFFLKMINCAIINLDTLALTHILQVVQRRPCSRTDKDIVT